MSWTLTSEFAFCQSLWPQLNYEDFIKRRDQYSRYFYFIWERLRFLNDNRADYPMETLEDLTKLVGILRADMSVKHDELVQKHANSYEVSGEVMSRTFQAVAAIWLTCRIRINGVDVSHYDSYYTRHFDWNQDQSIVETLHARLPAQSRAHEAAADDTIADTFSMERLCKDHDFHMNWTNYLQDHLHIDWANREIMFFQHFIYLHNYLDDEGTLSITPIPRNIIEEAADTIYLFFPETKGTSDFLKKKQWPPGGLLERGGRARKLRISDYYHWYDQVRDLKKHSEEPPHGFRQLKPAHGRKDGRNCLDIVALWTGVLVLLLTGITIVLGVAGVIYAKKSHDTEEEELKAVKAMACADANAAARLVRGYCETF
ncbi:hypothetical protein F5Y18DRAFT_425757 [Xylariaceae sp. FL1019]|nr:hypothetical protein F5Y18DRAFT_425757 [Xylariaceae sp. FL1019]